MRSRDAPLFLSPPVVQHASENGFTVSIEVSRLCMGRVEWGFDADSLVHRAVPAHGGLIDASDRALMLPVRFPSPLAPGRSICYRVVAEALDYRSAYDIVRSDAVCTGVRVLRLLHRNQAALTLAVVNDTHEQAETLAALSARIEALDPDILVWNGDVCRHFNAGDNPAALLLRPGGAGVGDPSSGGWVSTRPLLYVPGNHDVRGEHARVRPSILAAGPNPDLPYNMALRIGPLAIVTLDSGEDKPDRHPVFAGTAAYEPYRELQGAWLAAQLRRPDIADAPFRVAFSHIPLRGLPGENDGSILEGHARYCGQGQALWLPQLTAARFHAVVSGHTHEWRVDKPTADVPLTQVVGGGPQPDIATVVLVEACEAGLSISIQDLKGELLGQKAWARGRQKAG